jgi:hypothetical protein
MEEKKSTAWDKMKENYELEIEKVCDELKLPAHYFKALVILECGGEKPAGNRYEPHVFQRLKQVRSGKSKRYGKFTTKHLQLVTENTLKKMATSWGPFQIMGYHCISLGITLDELNGKEAIKNGIIWAKKNYGQYLEDRDFRQAFHIHNTGQTIPLNGIPITHDRFYIDKGLEFMEKAKLEKRKLLKKKGILKEK